jgi:glycosyltransferase involved in cell wall biosynthesis
MTPSSPHPLTIDTGGGYLNDIQSTSSQPLVTAVVTTYNRPELVKRAIKSVLDQTYAPLEFIIVEDGTDTGIHDWLHKLGHNEVRYVCHTENQGLASARNTAIAVADGDYIAFLDDDDVWKPDRIEQQISLLESLPATEREQIGVVYCGLESRRDGAVQSILHPENDGNLAVSIREDGASTVQSACLFQRDALVDVGGYDEELPSSIDHDIWMSLAVGGYSALALDEPLVISFDDFADSMMTNTDQRIRGVELYVEKWRPTYQEWFGSVDGDQYAKRYFTQVVGRLMTTKLLTGQIGEAMRAFDAILEKAGWKQFPYIIGVCIRLSVETGIKRFLPVTIVRAISKVIKRF